jgi:hypothetical protein
MAGSCDHGNGYSGSIKKWGISRLTEELGICSWAVLHEGGLVSR